MYLLCLLCLRDLFDLMANARVCNRPVLKKTIQATQKQAQFQVQVDLCFKKLQKSSILLAFEEFMEEVVVELKFIEQVGVQQGHMGEIKPHFREREKNVKICTTLENIGHALKEKRAQFCWNICYKKQLATL